MGRLFGNNLLATGMLNTARRRRLRVARAEFRKPSANRKSDMGLRQTAVSGRLGGVFFWIRSPPSTIRRLGYRDLLRISALFKQAFQQRPSNRAPRQTGTCSAIRGKSSDRNTNPAGSHSTGRVENVFDDRGITAPRWVDSKTLLGVPHDIPIAGLWHEKRSTCSDFGHRGRRKTSILAAFNSGRVRRGGAGKRRSAKRSQKYCIRKRQDRETARNSGLGSQQYFFHRLPRWRDILRRPFSGRAAIHGTTFADKVAVQV